MSGWKIKMAIVFFFVLVIFSSAVFSFSNGKIAGDFFRSQELFSPSDWVTEEQIKVYKDSVVLDIKDATWAKFTDTNSMDPFFDEKSNAIEILPKHPEDIKVGDVISFRSSYGTVIHRVIEVGEDSLGLYYLTKGDNNSYPDPFKVRFSDVRGVVVAVVY